MPRAGLTPDRIVDTAAEVADERGYAELTLAALAQRLGVALPSLYKHVRGLADVRGRLAARTTRELGDALARATVGRARGDAVRALADAYRAYAHAHPGRYSTLLRAPDPGDTEHVAASEAVLATIYAVLDGYGVRGDHAVDATRALRSALHGFVALEAAGGFGLPRDVDRSFAVLVTLFADALDRQKEPIGSAKK